MARGGNDKSGRSAAEQTNPEAEERKRLRKLAISKNLLSEAPAKASSLALNPSKTVIKHHGADVLRKSTRKNRFLFSFPGLISPISGGKLGELKDLSSKNPILYLDFPQVCLLHLVICFRLCLRIQSGWKLWEFTSPRVSGRIW